MLHFRVPHGITSSHKYSRGRSLFLSAPCPIPWSPPPKGSQAQDAQRPGKAAQTGQRGQPCSAEMATLQEQAKRAQMLHFPLAVAWVSGTGCSWRPRRSLYKAFDNHCALQRETSHPQHGVQPYPAPQLGSTRHRVPSCGANTHSVHTPQGESFTNRLHPNKPWPQAIHPPQEGPRVIRAWERQEGMRREGAALRLRHTAQAVPGGPCPWAGPGSQTCQPNRAWLQHVAEPAAPSPWQPICSVVCVCPCHRSPAKLQGWGCGIGVRCSLRTQG